MTANDLLAESRNIWFPVVLRLDNTTKALVIGGGEVAANKVSLLLATDTRIIVISPTLCDELQRALHAGRVEHIATEATRAVLETHLPGARLVYAATNDKAVNHLTAELAQALNIPVCAVDDPDPSSFITPAIVRRGPVMVAISTSGAAPVLARRIRERIEAMLPAGISRLSRFMQNARGRMAQIHPSPETRRRVWENFLDGRGMEQALAGDESGASTTLDRLASDEKGG